MFAGGNPHVRFLGDVARNDVPTLLSGARALLVPSRSYEGAPLVVAEAFAAGVPVIASDLGGTAEAVRDDVNGLVVPSRDVSAWRTAMTRLLDDDNNARLGKGATITWRERFAPERVVQQLEGAYRTARERRASVSPR
jgi:glycosyltransferase involved in cell wall biosynthesis